MDLPPVILLATTLKPGTVYLIKDPQFTNSKPHFAVVLNNKIESNGILYLAIATSQIEGRRRYVRIRQLPKETLVFTSQKECSFLYKETVFNCNDILERTVHEILVKVEIKEIISVYQAPEGLLNRIRDGVLKSPLIKRKVKQEVTYK